MLKKAVFEVISLNGGHPKNNCNIDLYSKYFELTFYIEII